MARFPHALVHGSTVGIVAASLPLASEYPTRFHRGVRYLNRLGLQVRVADHVKRASGFTCGPAEIIAQEINDLLADRAIDGIFTAIGGFNSNRILPLIDYERLRQDPKVVVGFSDTTTLLLALHAKCEWITFYGPAVMPQFGEYPSVLEFTQESLKDALFGSEAPYVLKTPRTYIAEDLDWGSRESTARVRTQAPYPLPRVVRGGFGEGIMFGGNIETINFLVGTEYFSAPPSCILFLEATEEEAFLPRIHRSLTHLKMVGLFERTSGLLFGYLPDVLYYGQSVDDVLLSVTDGYSFPILAGLAFGHIDPQLTVPIGVHCSVSADTTPEVCILERPTRL